MTATDELVAAGSVRVSAKWKARVARAASRPFAAVALDPDGNRRSWIRQPWYYRCLPSE